MIEANWRNGCGTHLPQLMTSVDGTYQVGVLIALNWDLIVFKRVFATNTYTTFNLSSVSALVTYGITPIMSDALGGDVHWGAAIAIDDQNRTWVAGNSLSTPGRMIRSAPNSITSWTALTWPFPGMPETTPGSGISATGENMITYHQFGRLSTGEILWTISQRDEGGAAEGIDYLGFRLPVGTSAWAPLIGNGELFTADAGPPERNYHGGLFVEQHPHPNRVWLAGHFRHDWTDVNTQRDPFILYNDTVADPATWKRIDGTPQTMPTTYANLIGTSAMIPIVGPSPPGWYAAGMFTVDRQGRPHLINAFGPNNWHIWYDGATWQTEQSSEALANSPVPFALRDGNVMMYRTRSNRVRVSKILAGNPVFHLGGPVAGTGGFANAYPDPIQAAQGNLHLLIADGDTPRVWTLGNHCPCYAA